MEGFFSGRSLNTLGRAFMLSLRCAVEFEAALPYRIHPSTLTLP